MHPTKKLHVTRRHLPKGNFVLREPGSEECWEYEKYCGQHPNGCQNNWTTHDAREVRKMKTGPKIKALHFTADFSAVNMVFNLIWALVALCNLIGITEVLPHFSPSFFATLVSSRPDVERNSYGSHTGSEKVGRSRHKKVYRLTLKTCATKAGFFHQRSKSMFAFSLEVVMTCMAIFGSRVKSVR